MMFDELPAGRIMKEGRERKAMSGTDFINRLPDSLLIHILSFLSTKEAVLTSLVSKQWKNLWASVPVLNFDYAEFLPQTRKRSIDEEIYQNTKFETFVNAVLNLREDVQLDVFQLSWNQNFLHYPGSNNPFMTWIERAVTLRPRVMLIDVVSDDWLLLPNSVFTCASLESLGFSLKSMEDLELKALFMEAFGPSLVNLPRLRRLGIGFQEINSKIMNKYLSGCPLLEELKMHNCSLNVTEISSHTLKHLILGPNNCYEMIRIAVSTLQYFRIYIGSGEGKVSFQEIPHVVKASICFVADDEGEFTQRNSSFLSSLRNVTTLEFKMITPAFMVMLPDTLKRCPIFKNLKNLIFRGGSLDFCLVLIAYFRHLFPNLEKFTLDYKDSLVVTLEDTEGFHTGSITRAELTSEPWKIPIQFEHIQLVEIKYKKKDILVDDLVKILHKHVKKIGKLSIELLRD